MIHQIASRDTLGRVRPLNPSRDLGYLADLIEGAFGEELSNGGERVLREIRLLSALGPLNWFLSSMSSEVDGIFTSYVWEHSGRVVGNVTISRPTGHQRRWQISNVAVLKEYQGRGIARRLMEAAIAQILQRGGHVAYLFVRENNPAALHLYRSLGFSQLDRTTDLRLDSSLRSAGTGELDRLRLLRPEEGALLYDLVVEAAGPGYQWLHTIRKSQYAPSDEDRFFRRLGSLFSAERETYWGIFGEKGLEAGLTLRARCLWNTRPHQLGLWLDPGCGEQTARALGQDVVRLLSRQSNRPADLTLPSCEQPIVDALTECGFRTLRTLMLMKLEL